MMGPGFFAEAIGGPMVRFIAWLAVGCFAAGALAVWGLPHLWAWVKPLLLEALK